MTGSHHAGARRFLPLAALLMAAAALADLAIFWFAPQAALFPKRPAPPPPATAEAVLFNDFGSIAPGINAETARRLNHAIDIYRNGQAKHLIMAGGHRPSLARSGADLMAEYARNAGIPAAAIVTDTDSIDSRSNLASISRLMATNHWPRLLLVSSPHHLDRLRRLHLLPPDASWSLAPYDPGRCSPALSRYELWRSAHYNLVAETLCEILPADRYQQLVVWVRHHTTL